MVGGFSFPTEQFVLIGKISKAHGLKGEVKICPFSGKSNSITQHGKLFLVASHGNVSPALRVLKVRGSGREVIVSLEGVTDRSRAETYCGCGVLVQKEDLPVPEDDGFYLHELEGIQVKTVAGRELGRVEAFFDNGVQDILVVRGSDNEYLIPLIPGMIVERNEELLTIAPPPGLLEMNSGDGDEGN